MSVSLVPIRRQHGDVPFRFFAPKNIGHEFTGDWAKAQAHHAVTRRHGNICETGTSSDIRQSVRRTGPQSTPWLDTIEIGGPELGKIAAEGVYDAAYPDGVYILVETGNLHCAAHAQGSIHRSHGDPRLGADGTYLRKLTRFWERQAIPFACLHWEFSTPHPRRHTQQRARPHNK